MIKSNKRGFVIIAIIVGAAGVGIGTYTITTVGTNGEQQYLTASTIDVGIAQELDSLMLHSSPVQGSMDAPITIIDLGDYQCSRCWRFATQVEPLIVENYVNTGKAKLVFKDFTIYGNDSVNAAIAAHCATDQNKYWEIHDHFYQNQEAINSGWLSNSNIKKLASEVDLDMEQFNSCLDERKYYQNVQNNVEKGMSIGVSGIPTFIIIDRGGQSAIIEGPQPYSVFKQVLDEMLAS